MNAVLELRESKNRITKFCRILKWVFYVVLVAYAACSILIVAIAILLPDGFSYVGPEHAFAVAPIFMDLVIGGFAIFVFAKLCSLVSKGDSPFSAKSSNLLVALGALICVSVVLKVFIAPGTDFGVETQTGEAVVNYVQSTTGDTFIDARGVLEGVACFVLAAIFRYGALLQKDSDDLV